MSDFGEVEKLAADLRKAGPAAQTKAVKAVRKAAFDVQAYGKANAMRLFRPPTSTGATANSISVSMTGPTSAEVGPTTSYSPFLEWGTRRMAERPFMGPALNKAEPGFIAAMEQLGGEML